jgi:tetratricopeptide (TPR) repeat protein
MKAPVSSAVLLLCLGCAHSTAVAQKTPAQRTVAAVVVNADVQPAQPVPTVRVSLSYLDSAVRVTEARDVTNPNGQAWLDVSEDAAQRGGLRIEIDGATNLVIYQPADGQLTALPASINVSLLPKGSPALLGPPQIEAMLHRTLVQVSSLQKQVTALKQSAAAAQDQEPDLGAAIAGWAQANGFSAAQADQQVQQWAEGIQKQSGQVTAEQKALSELALKHYANAARLFNVAGDADRQQISEEDTQELALEAQAKALQAAQQALLAKQRNSLQQLLDNSQQAAGAYQLNLEYHQATLTLENAEATAAAEYRNHPDDGGFHQLWLQAVSDMAAARRAEGEVSPANVSLGLLARSVDDFESLAHDYAAAGDRRESAAAQAGLGNALEDEGERASGDKATAFFDKAVQAFQKALEVRTKADLPKDWAVTQNDLGIALESEGERASADKAPAFFDQAVQAFDQALEVMTKANLPQDWAKTQFNLGIALTQEGQRALGAKSNALLDGAVQAFARALEVDTKADFPERWALTQDALGLALNVEGQRSSQADNVALLDRAVQAFKSALEVITRDGLPQTWARIQNNLGSALENEGLRASDEKAPGLFDQAVHAYQSALEVYSKADLPQDWGMTQNNLGLAFMDMGERTSGDQAALLFAQSAQAFKDSLEVFSKADLPQYWASVQMNLGDALAGEALHTTADKAPALFDQAIQAYEKTLEVRTKAELPADWADAQMNIMELSFVAARYSTCMQRVAILTDDALSRPQAVVRDTIELACQWGAGDKNAARQTEKALLSKSAMLEASVWDFSASLQILSASPTFSNGRASWIALFTAVQNGDAAGMTAALHQIEPLLQQ